VEDVQNYPTNICRQPESKTEIEITDNLLGYFQLLLEFHNKQIRQQTKSECLGTNALCAPAAEQLPASGDASDDKISPIASLEKCAALE
jgi:hypothetical protein